MKFIIPAFITVLLSGCVVNPYPYNSSYQKTEFYAPANSTLIYHETNVYHQNNYNYYERDYRHNHNKIKHHRIPYKPTNHYRPDDQHRFNYNKSDRNNGGGLIIKIK